MKPFHLLYTAEARKRICHLHPAAKSDVRAALDALAENPALGNPLQRNLVGLRSLRVKTSRILYRIDDARQTIEVLTIGLRSTIYDEYSG